MESKGTIYVLRNQDLFVFGKIIVENEDTIGLLFIFLVEFTVKTKSEIYVF